MGAVLVWMHRKRFSGVKVCKSLVRRSCVSIALLPEHRHLQHIRRTAALAAAGADNGQYGE